MYVCAEGVAGLLSGVDHDGLKIARSSRGRLLGLAVVPVVLVGSGVFAMQAGAVDDLRGLRHGRDVASYSDYVHTYIGQDYDGTNPGAGPTDRAVVQAHPDAVLSAGEAACRWLRSQPRAPRIDPTRSWDGPYTVQTVLNRFADTPLPEAPSLSRSGRASIAAGAWEYLCRADRAQRTAATGLPED